MASGILTAILHRLKTSTDFSTLRFSHNSLSAAGDLILKSRPVAKKLCLISYLAAAHITEEIGVGLGGLEFVD